jgi:hypothetical protein
MPSTRPPLAALVTPSSPLRSRGAKRPDEESNRASSTLDLSLEFGESRDRLRQGRSRASAMRGACWDFRSHRVRR